MPFHRKRWDPQPTDACDILLASDGRRDFSPRAVAHAAALARSGGSVGVVTIARIYGTQFGLPNPGLLPTKQELLERQRWVSAAISQLKRTGVAADGQVAATRKPTKKLAGVARARSVRHIVIDANPDSGWRRFVEGDVGEELRKKLRDTGITIDVIPAGAAERS